MSKHALPDGDITTRPAQRLPDSSYIEIPLTKCAMFLTEAELLKLPPEIWQQGIARGKAIKRRRQFEQRQASR